MKLPCLLFDIGGTKTRLAMSIDGKSFEKPAILSTPKDFKEGIELISVTARALFDGKVSVAAGGIAGPLNMEKSETIAAPNLPGWNNKPLKAELEAVFGAKVFLENDTAMVGLGEAVVGSGKDHEIVVYITISTGVNGAKITKGEIDENVFGFEVGHQIIDFDNSALNAPSGRGELEDFISGREVSRRFGEDPKNIDDPKVWEEIARFAAVGIHNTILHWSPEIVVFGGGMMKDISLERLESELKKILNIYPKLPVLKKAALGDIGGLHGALHYLNIDEGG